jgi:hypothetical protein
MEKIKKIYFSAYFIFVIGRLAVLEQFWLYWYLATDFCPVSTVKRIISNPYCPGTVIKLFAYYRMRPGARHWSVIFFDWVVNKAV